MPDTYTESTAAVPGVTPAGWNPTPGAAAAGDAPLGLEPRPGADLPTAAAIKALYGPLATPELIAQVEAGRAARRPAAPAPAVDPQYPPLPPR